jgi:glutathionyl-hydroquinone reductase
MSLGLRLPGLWADDSEIIRMFYTEFDSLLPEGKKGVTFYPKKFGKEIDEINDWVYNTVNNGSARVKSLY